MSLLITSYRPDIVIYNSQSSSITLLELTCPLDSIHHIQSARNRKQSKTEYLQLLAEFDRLNIANYYDTIEITVLGHFQVSSIKNLSSLLNFVQADIRISKHIIKEWLDAAASASISASENFSSTKLYRVVHKLDSFIFVITVISLFCCCCFTLPCPQCSPLLFVFACCPRFHMPICFVVHLFITIVNDGSLSWQVVRLFNHVIRCT